MPEDMGTTCPLCDGVVDYRPMEYEAAKRATERVVCTGCGTEWVQTWELIDRERVVVVDE